MMAAKGHEAAPATDDIDLDRDEVLEQMKKDDQEEWEYEYSNTETETFYLTVDLSYPEFKETVNKASHHSRGGYYKNWQETNAEATPAARAEAALKRQKQEEQEQQRTTREAESIPNAERTPAAESERKVEDDEDMPMIDPALRHHGTDMASSPAPNSPTAEPEARAISQPEPDNDGNPDDEDDRGDNDAEPPESLEDIQILELHSDHPYISYKGRLFEGTWAEVIGTEAILTVRDEKRPLPALRHLAENVELLAASSVRLSTKEKTVKPKQPEADPLAAIREEWNIRIPVSKDKTGERRQQASFLENLMALKKMRGDEDEVTVYATDGRGKDFDDDKDPDYRPRRKRTTGSEAPAKQRRARARARGGRRPGATGRSGRPRGGASGGLSTPTPAHWGDNRAHEETIEDDDEDDDDGDVSMGE